MAKSLLFWLDNDDTVIHEQRHSVIFISNFQQFRISNFQQFCPGQRAVTILFITGYLCLDGVVKENPSVMKNFRIKYLKGERTFYWGVFI